MTGLLAWFLVVAAAGAQVEVQAELEGRVLRADQPLAGVQVVLHRVSADSAGELDSIPTDDQGRFRFRLPALPDEGEGGRVYFASVRHQGVLYFGPALSRPVQLDSLYTVQAWDTLPAPPGGAEIPIGVRYLILESVPEGWQVTDLFELEVGPGRTLVAAEGGATWRHPLPDGARATEGPGADLGAGELAGPRVEEGHVVVRAPLSPGPRQFVVRYVVPELDGLAIPFGQAVGTVELLVQEPVPDLDVTGLDAIEAVEMEPGVRYRHFTGSFPGSTVVTIRAAEAPFRLPLEWTAVVLGLLLAAVGVFAVRRGEGAPSPAEPVDELAGLDAASPEGRQRLLVAVARIDERLEDDALGAGERSALERRRVALLARLRGGR